MGELSIRSARVEDATAIARVHVQAWQETYTEHFPAEFLTQLADIISVDIWKSTIEDAAVDVHVAEAGGTVVGWASAGIGRDDDAPVQREVLGIYVIRDFHGSGAGQQLLEASIGAEPTYLWIAEGNPRAEAFYAKNGFVRDGSTRVTPFADQTVQTVRMVRAG